MEIGCLLVENELPEVGAIFGLQFRGILISKSQLKFKPQIPLFSQPRYSRCYIIITTQTSSVFSVASVLQIFKFAGK